MRQYRLSFFGMHLLGCCIILRNRPRSHFRASRARFDPSLRLVFFAAWLCDLADDSKKIVAACVFTNQSMVGANARRVNEVVCF